MRYTLEEEKEIMKDIWSEEFYFNPLSFVMYAFPWGKKNTFLEHVKGPRKWQKEELINLGRHVKSNHMLETIDIFKLAISSGRGTGKTALICQILIWAMCTRIGIKAIIASNTEAQLKNVFWAELKKWFTSLICAHWFDVRTLDVKVANWLKELVEEQMGRSTEMWNAEGKIWTPENPSAIAGPHNTEGMFVIFEEASGIIDTVWEVVEGYFTEPNPNRFHVAISNPRRNTGEFYNIFNEKRQDWRKLQIDSRTVEDTDPALYAGIIQKYGENSYQAKVEVKGEFPDADDNLFIPKSVIEEAMKRKPEDVPQPDSVKKIMGIDWSGQGKDKTSVQVRKGYHHIWSKSTVATEQDQILSFVINQIHETNPHVIYGDDGGLGWVLNGLLISMGYKVIRVNNSWKSSNKNRWVNLRSELWDKMRIWYKKASVIYDKERMDKLCQIKVHLDSPLRLVSKEVMRKQGLASPDEDDALSLTFMSKEVELTDMDQNNNRKTIKPSKLSSTCNWMAI